MPWGRITDRVNELEKFLALSDTAWRLYWSAVAYCQKELTDGLVPAYKLAQFGVRGSVPKATTELCAALVPGKGPLFHKVDGGYQVHDYLDWNDSADKIRANREGARQRMQVKRSPGRSREHTAEHAGLFAQPFARTEQPNGKVFAGSFGRVPQIHIPKEEGSSLNLKGSSQGSTPPKTAARSQDSYNRNSIRRMAATCHRVFETTTYTDRPSIVEEFKTACARQRLPYGERIAPNGSMAWVWVFDHVERKRARKAPQRQRRAS